MHICRDYYHLPDIAGSVLTIGNFDGMHRGHQMMFSQLVDRAKALQLPSVVVLFEPQPEERFATVPYPRLLRLRDKLRFLETTGVDIVCLIHFTEKFAALSPQDFVQHWLVEKLHVKHLLVGEDFRFGAHRAGDITTLKALARQFHFTIDKVNPILFQHRRISSSWVREATQMSDLALVETLLGRRFSISGHIAHGDQRGRELGFPTINLCLPKHCFALLGVYVVHVSGLASESISGIANIGTRPTFHDNQLLLEVYLLDFNRTVYGHLVEVTFLKKIRDIQQFPSPQDLISQMQQDEREARAFFRDENK